MLRVQRSRVERDRVPGDLDLGNLAVRVADRLVGVEREERPLMPAPFLLGQCR